MKHMTYRFLAFAVLTALTLTVPIATAAADGPEPERMAFLGTWNRTDRPVADGLVDRTWMWGPWNPTPLIQEPYAESPNGYRTVQYFDKARMEITNPQGDNTDNWYVTNGLLVTELISGKLQVGDTTFIDRQPADINVAGDLDDPNAPTYAQLARLLTDPAIAPGMPITQRLDPDGNVTIDRNMVAEGVTAAYLYTDGERSHSVASVFWEFMHSTGVVYGILDGEPTYFEDKLFQNPFYATGYPVTEAYWTTVTVGGASQDVLLQCFERRCLTYTPGNPDGWKVEAGNVGLHYQQWRHGRIAFPAWSLEAGFEIVIASGDGSDVVRIGDTQVYGDRIAWSPDGRRFAYVTGNEGLGDIYLMNADGTGKINLTNDPASYYEIAWSPDGTRLVFSVDDAERDEIHVINTDGSGRQRIGTGTQIAWSPDGDQIAYTAATSDGEQLQYDLFVMHADGANPVNLTNDVEFDGGAAWSPDGTRIAFVHAYIHTSDIVVINADGSGRHQLTDTTDANYAPVWSPAGDRIAFTSNRNDNYDLYVINPDGSGEIQLTTDPGADVMPDFSPDGARLAFLSDRDGSERVYVISAEGGEPVPLLADAVPGGRPFWSP